MATYLSDIYNGGNRKKKKKPFTETPRLSSEASLYSLRSGRDSEDMVPSGEPPLSSEIPNLPPPQSPTALLEKGQGGGDIMSNLANLAKIYQGTQGGGGGMEGMTSLAALASGGESKTPLMDDWSKPVVAGVPKDKFVSMAGLLAHAISPRSVGGRLGAGLYSFASPIYGERMKREGEAASHVPNKWEVYWKGVEPKINAGEMTRDEAISNWHKITAAEKSPDYVEHIRLKPGTEDEYEKGWIQKGGTDFVPYGAPTPAEIKELKGIEKDPTTIQAAIVQAHNRGDMEEVNRLTEISRSLKPVKPTKPEKPGWYTADVGGKPQRMKQTEANVAKYPVWQKPSKEDEFSLEDAAKDLYEAQIYRVGGKEQLIEPDESKLLAIREKLKPTPYELVQVDKGAEEPAKVPLFGWDIPFTGEEPYKMWEIQEKAKATPKAEAKPQITKEQALEELRRRGKIQ